MGFLSIIPSSGGLFPLNIYYLTTNVHQDDDNILNLQSLSLGVPFLLLAETFVCIDIYVLYHHLSRLIQVFLLYTPVHACNIFFWTVYLSSFTSIKLLYLSHFLTQQFGL